MSIIEILNTETHLASSLLEGLINKKNVYIGILTTRLFSCQDEDEKRRIVSELDTLHKAIFTLRELEERK